MSNLMSNLIYSSRFMSTNAYLQSSITLLDDGLKRDRFVYIGWSGLILLPTSYLSIGAWLTSTSFVTSFYTHALTTSYLEGCNLLTASVSTPNTMGHAYLLIWSSEASLSLTPWVCLGGTWTLITFHGLISIPSFTLRQYEIAYLTSIRPYNALALAFSGPMSVYRSVFLLYIPSWPI